MKYVQTILAAALIAGVSTIAMAADADTTAAAPAAAKPAVHKAHHRHHVVAKAHQKAVAPHQEEAAPAAAHDSWMGTPHSMNNVPTKD